MNEKTLRILEYDKIKQMLRDYCVSAKAKAACDDLLPYQNKSAVEQALAETSEAFAALVKKDVHVGVIGDVGYALKMAEIGSSLNAGQLLQISDAMRTARHLKKYIEEIDSNFCKVPILSGHALTIGNFKAIEAEVERCIISEHEIADNASSQLRQIRRSIDNKEAQIRSKLDGMIASSSMQKYLQDSIVTIRQDRFVIPVKSEHKGHIKGIVHDQSGSGATFYIEPMAIVNLNNELRELTIAEKREIERILMELSQLIAQQVVEIRLTIDALTRLDFIFAKGKLSIAQRGCAAEISAARHIVIKNGKHPLIAGDQVVPINFRLGQNFTSLLITGPNTGGKTVSLKTVGLFALMTQSGLHIPADHGSMFPIFSGVYADIGDEQSIEQSLSTFSSHMKNIVDIIDHVDARTLVLFDELGAGTDPTEGAALAMAILNDVKAKGALSVATTHYSELKHFALATEGFANASVEFDVVTLSPTYRLLIGVPGKSNAFEISKKLGLSEAIIDSANRLIDKENIAFEDVLSAIEDNRRQSEADRDEAIRLKLEAQKLFDKAAEKQNKTENQRSRLLREAKAEARQLLKQTRAESDQLLRDLKSLRQQAGFDNKRFEQLRQGLRAREKELQPAIEKQVAGEVPKKLRLGQEVLITTLGQKGSVIALPDQRGEVQLQVGIIKMTANIDDLRIVEQTSNTKKKQRTKYGGDISAVVAKREVDLRGQTLEEAMFNLDKYLDDALLSHHNQVTVIHGIGTGVLKRGLTDFLRRHSHVKTMRPGAFGEGGAGVTIVTLK